MLDVLEVVIGRLVHFLQKSLTQLALRHFHRWNRSHQILRKSRAVNAQDGALEQLACWGPLNVALGAATQLRLVGLVVAAVAVAVVWKKSGSTAEGRWWSNAVTWLERGELGRGNNKPTDLVHNRLVPHRLAIGQWWCRGVIETAHASQCTYKTNNKKPRAAKRHALVYTELYGCFCCTIVVVESAVLLHPNDNVLHVIDASCCSLRHKQAQHSHTHNKQDDRTSHGIGSKVGRWCW